MLLFIALGILINFFSIVSCRFSKQENNRIYVFLSFILLLYTLLHDFKVSVDYDIYQRLYRLAPPLDLLLNDISKYKSLLYTEFSYSILATFIKHFSTLSEEANLSIIFSIYALLGVTTNTYGIYKLTENKLQTLFIYFCNLFILHELTQVRAGVAIGFIFIALYHLKEDNYLKFFIFTMIATFFHTSAYLILLVPIFKYFNLTYRFWTLLFLICIYCNVSNLDIVNIIDFIPNEYFQYRLKAYLVKQEAEDFVINYFNIFFLLQLTVITLCFIYREKLNAIDHNIKTLVEMCCISSCLYVFLYSIPGMAVRTQELFNCVLPILIPSLTYIIKPKAVMELIVYLIGWWMLANNVILNKMILLEPLF